MYRYLRAVAKDRKFDCDSASVVIFTNDICRRNPGAQPRCANPQCPSKTGNGKANSLQFARVRPGPFASQTANTVESV